MMTVTHETHKIHLAILGILLVDGKCGKDGKGIFAAVRIVNTLHT
jgi:hypothetical protein